MVCMYECKTNADGHITHSTKCSAVEHEFCCWLEYARVVGTPTSLMRDFFMSSRLTQDYIIVVWGLPL